MNITWEGTNTLRIEAAGEKLLIDPFVELRGGSNPNALSDFMDADTVLITHGHFDHLVFVTELLTGGDMTVYCSKTPAETLEEYTDGTEGTDQVAVIRPGMTIPFGKVLVRVLRGKHIRFDAKLIAQTLLSPRMVRYGANLPFLFWAARHFPEQAETLVYELEAEGKRIQILGSLGLHPEETYRPGADLLIMPFQGKRNALLVQEADRVIRALAPKRILLSHFDDAFPPISTDVDLRGLKRLLKEKYPGIPTVKPTAGRPVRL